MQHFALRLLHSVCSLKVKIAYYEKVYEEMVYVCNGIVCCIGFSILFG